MMEGFAKVAQQDEITIGRPKRAFLDGSDLVVFLAEGQLFAVENNCPHQHFSKLHEGTLDGCHLTCPMHGWTFDLRTGNSVNGDGKLTTYEVRILNKDVWVERPEKKQKFRTAP